jgi:ferredoxin-NADP reductase
MPVETQTSGTKDTTVYKEYENDLLVERKDSAAAGVVSLTLTEPSGGQLPAWTPGAHIDVILPGIAATRQYSLCGSPRDRHRWRIGVLNDPGSRGGSRYIRDQVEPGTLVRVRGPRNHFPLIDAAHYLFIAGGIGITPILPMIAAACGAGADWRLAYGGRTRASMAFLDELEHHGDRVQIYPEDEAGLIPLPSLLAEPRDDLLVYCCGPEPLIQAVEGYAPPWPAGNLHRERFSPKSVAESPEALGPFEVVCRRSGITLTVDASTSILEAAEKAGLHVLSSCREGTCGTCEVDVLEGDIDHRDSVLSPEDQETNEFMMTCVSRSKSPVLVLDL